MSSSRRQKRTRGRLCWPTPASLPSVTAVQLHCRACCRNGPERVWCSCTAQRREEREESLAQRWLHGRLRCADACYVEASTVEAQARMEGSTRANGHASSQPANPEWDGPASNLHLRPLRLNLFKIYFYI
jgi:hypothetical protein